MNLTHWTILLGLIACGCQSVGEPPEQPARARATTAFVNVNVVPMDSERILTNQAVLVQGRRIIAIGPSASTPVPDGAIRIDGAGRYLMPGLADMHVHVWYEDELPKFIANGVTTVRNMHGAPQNLEWQERIEAGGFLAPFLYTSGPVIDGVGVPFPEGTVVVTTPQAARQAVRKHKEAGYEFIKVRVGLSQAAYDAIVAEARQQDLAVVGHVPMSVGLEYVTKAGQRSIEHLDGISVAALRDDSPFVGRTDPRMAYMAWKEVDSDRLSEIARDLARAGTWVCPTLVSMQTDPMPDEMNAYLRRREMRFVRPDTIEMWKNSSAPVPFVQMLRDGVGARKRAVKALHDAGVSMVLGTDSPAGWVPHGFATLRELEILVDAGLSPYEAITMATRQAARLVGASDKFGTVSVGRRADLLLLEGDPLASVGNVAEPIGVMVRGRWYSRAELRATLDTLADGYR